MNLTEKQKRVFEFIKDFIQTKGVSPTYEEIRRYFGFKSVRSVQKYVMQLEERGYIRIPVRNKSRMITITEHGIPSVVIPMAGIVAAGRPIEAVEHDSTISVPQEMLGRGEYFALKVKGSSMVEDGIFDGDTIVVKKQSTAVNGQTVVALVQGEATVKKFYKKGGAVELKPANSSMKSIVVREGEFEIQGIVVGLLRRYR
ncbi:repressor LexA [candidate division KSB1 bacterium]|nr:MAG: repressor LexA [candidate division KSB1 bacterium]